MRDVDYNMKLINVYLRSSCSLSGCSHEASALDGERHRPRNKLPVPRTLREPLPLQASGGRPQQQQAFRYLAGGDLDYASLGNRVFAFLLAISEVNTWLAFRYFVWKGTGNNTTLLEFRRNLAKQFIYNGFVQRDHRDSSNRQQSKRVRQSVLHAYESAPNYAQKFHGGQSLCSDTDRYPQHVCKTKGCIKRIRTYCKCSPGHWLCKDCHGGHLQEVFQSD
jgi:hypothetical protein